MQYFTLGYYFSGGGKSGDSHSCLPRDEYQGLPHTVQFPASACGTQVSCFPVRILPHTTTIINSKISLSLSLSFSLSFPFLYLSLCISSLFCLPSFYPFLIVFLNFLFLSLQLDYIPFFPISIIKLNKMVKECFKFIYKCQYSVYFHDDIFFLEWHSYSPWSVRDQLILSTSLSMYNPILLLLCTQWMVGHIIDTWLNKFWWNQLSNSQNTTLKNPTIF